MSKIKAARPYPLPGYLQKMQLICFSRKASDPGFEESRAAGNLHHEISTLWSDIEQELGILDSRSLTDPQSFLAEVESSYSKKLNEYLDSHIQKMNLIASGTPSEIIDGNCHTSYLPKETAILPAFDNANHPIDRENNVYLNSADARKEQDRLRKIAASHLKFLKDFKPEFNSIFDAKRVKTQHPVHTNDSLSKQFGVAKTRRWADFSAYGMSLKQVMYREGNTLMMEGGDRYADALLMLGFREVEGEWIKAGDSSLDVRSARRIFPELHVAKDAEIKDVLVDRTTRSIPGYDGGANPSNLRDRVVQSVGKPKESVSPASLWIAQFELEDQFVQAFGTTPEQAMQALLETWQEHAPLESEDVTLISDFRSSILVSQAQIGKGYAMGVGRDLWFKDVVKAGEARFDEMFSAIPGRNTTSNNSPKP